MRKNRYNIIAGKSLYKAAAQPMSLKIYRTKDRDSLLCPVTPVFGLKMRADTCYVSALLSDISPYLRFWAKNGGEVVTRKTALALSKTQLARFLESYALRDEGHIHTGHISLHKLGKSPAACSRVLPGGKRQYGQGVRPKIAQIVSSLGRWLRGGRGYVVKSCFGFGCRKVGAFWQRLKMDYRRSIAALVNNLV